MNERGLPPDALQWLREAAEWRLLSLLFACPKDTWRRQLQTVALETLDGKLKEAAELAQEEASEGLYHTTFGPGGPAAPREVSHRETFTPGAFLSELCACYEAFAYRPAEVDPPDHIAIEAGFVSYLRFKQAYARYCGDDEALEIASQAVGRFLQSHVSVIARPLADSLAASGVGYLRLAAEALAARTPAPSRPRQPPGSQDQTPALELLDDFSCGCADEGG